MSLENEYFDIKNELENELEVLGNFQDQDISKMSESQLKAHDRGVKSIKISIEETNEILDEIKIELYDFIYNDGEVSKKTIGELHNDLLCDIFFKDKEMDDYDKEVLQGKVNFLNGLL